MKQILKTVLRIFGGILALVVVVVAALYLTGQARFKQPFGDVEAEPVAIPAGPEALGEKWAQTLCASCHGQDYAGKLLIEDPYIGMIGSPNLTGGAGGIGVYYTDSDWIRAIRHGVGPGDYPLMAMPSDGFYYLSDQDLAALIAYLKTVPPVDNQVAAPRLRPLAYILASAGKFGNVFPAESIKHEERPDIPSPGISEAYGQYLVRVADCDSCHGPDLAGGPSPLPISLPGPDITHGGSIAYWTPEEFIATIRTGVTPYGRQLDPAAMPWEAYAHFSDQELTAILTYLQGLPPREAD